MSPKNILEEKWTEAVALHKAGRLAEAEKLYCEILAVDPGIVPAWNFLGIAQNIQGRAGDALTAFDRALAIKPDFAPALTGRAQALWQLQRFADVVSAYDAVLALEPGGAEAWNFRGGALSFLGRPEDALASFSRAVALKPDYVEALNNRGATEQSLKQFAASLESFTRALAVVPAHPEVLNNRGVTLSEMGRYDEALASIEAALAARPEYVEAHYNRAGVLADLGRFEEAVIAYDRTIALKPQYAEAHYNRSLLVLLLGRPGWQDYEWRKRRSVQMTSRDHAQPHWLGQSDMSGKTLLLYWEQGLGDTIQFCRYAPLAAAKGAKVFLSVQGPLEGLLKQFEPALTVIGAEAVPAQFDFQCSLMSLPLAFGGEIPALPYLKADGGLAAAWAARLGPRTKPRIGIAWSGGEAHKDDHNRSIALEKILPLLTVDAQWISLQKEIRDSDRAAFNKSGIGFYGEALGDFRDTAALIEQMDLVISVDTSIAHLAGAMGKSVWILLPWRPDWRWQLGRDDSDWYPQARLLRQPVRGDWDGVIAKVKTGLAALFAAHA